LNSDGEVTSQPEWAREYFGSRNCRVFGDLIVCVQGTSKHMTVESILTGRPSSKVKVCFARVSRPDEYWCVRVIAPPGDVGKGTFPELLTPDAGEQGRGGRSVVAIVDYPSGVGVSLDRAGFSGRNAYYDEVVGATGKTSSIAIRVVRGPGEGAIERSRFLR